MISPLPPGLLAFALLASLGVAYYLVRVAKKPRLVYREQAAVRGLTTACPSLAQHYFPTPWAFNTHLQIGLLLLKEALEKPLVYDETEILVMPDGGTTAIEWLGLDLPAQQPTVILLPTITGCGQSIGSYARYLHRHLACRVAVCVRRGHGGLPLTAPQVNTLGSTSDLRQQIAHIESRFAKSTLYAVGVSAGSGLLVRYLGEQGDDTPIRAAFAYCPAYDIDVAFARAHPFYSSVMARKLVRHFLQPHRDIFHLHESFADCEQAGDLDEFHQHFYALAGFSNYEEFSASSNPMKVTNGITVPLLVLNARDDPICSGQNVDDNQHAIAELDHGLLVVTERGSHCAHFAGWTARPWAHQLMVEYFGAIHTMQPGTKPKRGLPA